MSHVLLSLSVTVALACASATLFLLLRCEGKGRAFGPRSRWWATAVIGLTGVLSTALAFVTFTVAHRLPAAFVSLGVLAPSTLWLGQIREGATERRSVYRDTLTLWLTRLLARMNEAMTEDREDWCEARIDPEWHTDELILAARFYHKYLHERLSAEERRRFRIRALRHAIEVRLDIARLIEGNSGRAKVAAALSAARIPQEPRYRRSLDDLTRLDRLLHHDARQDLSRLLSAAYSAGLRRLERYTPPPASPPRHGRGGGPQRPHP